MPPPPRYCIECRIVRNEPVSSRYRLMSLCAPAIAAQARPGQFVQLRPFPQADAGAFETHPLLPRPFAIYGVSGAAGRATIEIVYLVVGRGTEMMAALKPGDAATALGPLGVPFTVPGEADGLVAIGGGTGLAPLRFLLAGPVRANLSRHLVLGAREAAMHLDERTLDVPGCEVAIATDDGSAGFPGTAVDLAEQVLDGLDAGRVQVYAAGPVPMMRAAWRLCQRRGLGCQVSLEAIMACGVGVCRSCVVDVTEPDPATGLRRRAICVEGPVFDAARLDWSTVVRTHA